MVPVLPDKHVGAGGLGRGCPQGGVGVDEGSGGEEPPVRDAERPHPAVGAFDVIHEPVDGVVGVGGFIGGGWVLTGPAWGSG